MPVNQSGENAIVENSGNYDDVARDQFNYKTTKIGTQTNNHSNSYTSNQTYNINYDIGRAEAEPRQQIAEFLELLAYADCKDKHARSQDLLRPGVHSGHWFLHRNEFQQWANEPRSGLLWAYAKPGAGKTILTSIVIDALNRRKEDVTVVFFYCEHQDANKRDPRKLLSTILFDLIRNLGPHLPQSLAVQISDVLRSKTAITITLLRDMICTVSNECPRTFIVIDALDECEERAQLFPILEMISQHASVLVTSRDERDIRMSLEQCIGYHIHIQPEDISDEIGQFVNTEVQYRIRVGSLCVRNGDLVGEITRALTAGSDGMYLWVVLQLNNICQHRTEYGVQNALKDLPQGLDGIFIRSLQKIHSLSPSSRDRVKRALRWIICAFSPLSLSELVDAVALDEMDSTWDDARVVTDAQSLIDDCANLVTVVNGFVRVIHASVRDFLISKPESHRNTLPQYHIYPIHEAHYILTQNCVRFFTTFQDRCPLLFRTAWLEHVWNSGSLQDRLYQELFHTRVVRRSSNLGIVFPNATHVRVVNCKVFEGETYSDVFLRSGSAGSCFRRHHFPTMFPACRVLDLHSTEWSSAERNLANIYDSLASVKTVKVPRHLRRATHVQVTGVDFVLTDGPAFEFYPLDGVMVTYSGNGRDLNVPGPSAYFEVYNEISGSYLKKNVQDRLSYDPGFSALDPPIDTSSYVPNEPSNTPSTSFANPPSAPMNGPTNKFDFTGWLRRHSLMCGPGAIE